MERILVTGASGFVGRNITKALVADGYRIRAQYRRADPPEELRQAAAAGVELVRADLVESFENDRGGKLLEGIEAVIHTAAKVTTTGPRRMFDRINVEATRRLLQAASGAGCRRFVYLSSMAVHGFGEHLSSTENGPYYKLITNYQKTKKAAENIVSGYKCASMQTVILRPGFVYGPRDTTTLKPVFDLLVSNSLPMIGGFDVYSCLVYIDDFVKAVRLALQAEIPSGEIFDIAGNDTVTLKEAVLAAAAIMGVKPPWINISPALAMFAGGILDFVYKVLGINKEPLISRYLAQQLSYNFHFSTGKAKTLLGYVPEVDWRQGLEKAAAAYKRDNPRLFD
ncbi:MAG: NAD-dependent epimerase/dehydratase family protein [Spirochaetales bacterium]|nr:NAD-dependent epimerase/dehydratase family protein [Spirochaetales bacterium]